MQRGNTRHGFWSVILKAGFSDSLLSRCSMASGWYMQRYAVYLPVSSKCLCFTFKYFWTWHEEGHPAIGNYCCCSSRAFWNSDAHHIYLTTCVREWWIWTETSEQKCFWDDQERESWFGRKIRITLACVACQNRGGGRTGLLAINIRDRRQAGVVAT